jgi:hypothetical protein
LDAPPLPGGEELFEHELEASLAFVRSAAVVVHMERVPGGRMPRGSKQDIPKESMELPWLGGAG